MNSKYQKEIELVLLCARLDPDDRDVDRMEKLAAGVLDWSFIKETVLCNRVCPIVYKNFRRIKKNIPQDVMSRLKEMTFYTGGRSLALGTYLQQLIKAFDKEDIFVLPFKGPVLSEQVYKDSLLRTFADLDVLVARPDVLRAFDLLEKKGLSPQLALSRAQLAKYIEDEDHFSFYGTLQRILIELHWDMTGLYLSRQITVKDLEPYLENGHFEHTPVPCLSREALLVYLCVHGAKHGWENLEQICSVSELIKSTPDLDWETVRRISSEWQCRRMLNIGLHLADTLLKAPVPGYLKSDISTDGMIPEMAEKILSHLFYQQAEKNFSDRFSLFHIQVRDSFPEKVRYFLRLLFRPTDMEWQSFPVPGYLSFVHYFTRPCRLAYSWFKGGSDGPDNH